MKSNDAYDEIKARSNSAKRMGLAAGLALVVGAGAVAHENPNARMMAVAANDR